MARHLLTGAGSGIGAALADRLAERGDELVLLVRSNERAEELRSRHPEAEVFVADLADPESIEPAWPENLGPLDSFCLVAGSVDLGAVAEQDLATWWEQVTVNLISCAVLVRLALPMIRAGHGSVVFVNSGAGLSAGPGWSAYAAGKFGLRALADSLRAEESVHGVRVTSVFPSRTATAMQEKVHEQEGKEYDAALWTRPETVAASILHVLDLPRDATISDLVIRPGATRRE